MHVHSRKALEAALISGMPRHPITFGRVVMAEKYGEGRYRCDGQLAVRSERFFARLSYEPRWRIGAKYYSRDTFPWAAAHFAVLELTHSIGELCGWLVFELEGGRSTFCMLPQNFPWVVNMMVAAGAHSPDFSLRGTRVALQGVCWRVSLAWIAAVRGRTPERSRHRSHFRFHFIGAARAQAHARYFEMVFTDSDVAIRGNLRPGDGWVGPTFGELDCHPRPGYAPIPQYNE